MNLEKTRSIIIKILLATLVLTAAVAVGVILIGSVSDMFGRVIWTLVAGVFYLLILLGIMSTIPHINEGRTHRSTLFVVNSTLALTCASYLTSILSIWTVIDGDMPLRIHAAYIVLLLGILYATPFINIEPVYNKLRPYIYGVYTFIAISSLLIAFGIVAPSEWDLWNGFFGRLIAASFVILITLSMVITVIYHLYLQQHPELRAKMTVATIDGRPVSSTENTHPQRTSPWLVAAIIVAVLFGFPMLLGFFGGIMSFMFGTGSRW